MKTYLFKIVIIIQNENDVKTMEKIVFEKGLKKKPIISQCAKRTI